ncbi:hypothetical protein [Salinibacterium sp. ZJ450]|uniref:hypothetical protein n=1 Tax=Salinibacterium sp. ZJ450 TaxID=2708338 RepID=UPI0014246889|nr:hypothetical protein [Salinibacterium sp. ZJ450]
MQSDVLAAEQRFGYRLPVLIPSLHALFMRLYERDRMRKAIAGVVTEARSNWNGARYVRFRWTKTQGALLVAVLGEDSVPAPLTGTDRGLLGELAKLTDPAFANRAISMCRKIGGYTYEISVRDESFAGSSFDEDEFAFVLVKPLRDASGGLARAGFPNYDLDSVDMCWIVDFAQAPGARLFFGWFDWNRSLVGAPFIYRQTREAFAKPGLEYDLQDFARPVVPTRDALLTELSGMNTEISDLERTVDVIWAYFSDHFLVERSLRGRKTEP